MVQHPDGAKPTCLHILHWIARAWDQVQLTTILNTWQSIGIHPFNNNSKLNDYNSVWINLMSPPRLVFKLTRSL